MKDDQERRGREIAPWQPGPEWTSEDPLANELIRLLKRYLDEVADWLEDTFGFAEHIQRVAETAYEDSERLRVALIGYRRGEVEALSTLPLDIAELVREPPDSSLLAITCKTELLLAALMGWACYSHLFAGDLAAAIEAYGEGQRCLGTATGLADALWSAEWISAVASRGGMARHLNDPRRREKQMVRECWDAWQREPARYSGKAAFARDMLQKVEHLKSQPVIEAWCREWAGAGSRDIA
jgi:hypothetical protein